MLKAALKLLSLTAIVSCGTPDDSNDDRTYQQPDNTNGSCSVLEHDEGATIVCPDGTTAEITNGEQGVQGEIGETRIDKTAPIYVGSYCSRNVLRISGKFYLVNSQLILLSAAWVKVGRTCKLRLVNKEVVVGEQ